MYFRFNPLSFKCQSYCDSNVKTIFLTCLFSLSPCLYPLRLTRSLNLCQQEFGMYFLKVSLEMMCSAIYFVWTFFFFNLKQDASHGNYFSGR